MNQLSRKPLPAIKEVPLAGYSDRLSARAGETIEFKVSSTGDAPSIKSHLCQSICADANPAGPGIVERSADKWFTEHSFPARHQPFFPGSYAISDKPLSCDNNTIELSATVWPTRPGSGEQTILSCGALSLCLDANGSAAVRIGDQLVVTKQPIPLRQWATLTVVIERDSKRISIAATAKKGTTIATEESTLPDSVNTTAFSTAVCLIAARQVETESFGLQAACHFNGKIESPRIRTADKRENLTIVAHWDFSQGMSSTTVTDTGPNEVHATLINEPARAMTSSDWNGEEMCWRHSTPHYAAIHFHDDDIVAFNWQTDFSFTVPDGMPSGVYVMRISAGDYEDAMPFYVCAPKGHATNRLCVLIPAFTYAIYGNHARPDWQPDWNIRNKEWDAYPWNPAEYPAYGQSTYNFHSDGSGICHASHERPLFNLRPGYITFGNVSCSGLRHFQADSHLLAWLDANNIPFDVITDRELHNEGVDCLKDYDALMTTSHPEYHTPESLQALTDYRDQGGHLMYLGGNGFYWRVALHPENPNTIEIRRAEDGIRAWAAEPGEYYQAFDGGYGGLWRRNGKPPQALCGVGFSAQGQFNGSYYRRKPVSDEMTWIFDGIDDDNIGDFGLCGGGAAGFELDRADTRLGTPEHAVVLASSENHSDDFILVPEEMLTHITTLPGQPADDLIHADLIWIENQDSGCVFSVGSITFCGSLPHNNFDNNVSRLLLNVVNRVVASDN